MSINTLELAPGDLKPNPWNSNVVSPENEAKLEESIKRFGVFKPVIVRKLKNGDYQIIGGEHRATVAARMGIATIPVIDLGQIDDKKAKEISLVDNGRFGEDDIYKLSEIIKDIGGIGEIADFMPYSDKELDEMFSSTILAMDGLDALDVPLDDEEIELPKNTAMRTHQIMRFKVPNEDVDAITKLIEKTIKSQGFTESDSLTNAGDALVHLLTKAST